MRLDDARRALAEIKTIDEAKGILDVAHAAAVYARKAKLGLETQNHATEIKLRAERRAGELLEYLERKQGMRSDITSSTGGKSSPYARALKDNQLSYQAAYRWRRIASLPSADFEHHIATTKNSGGELTTKTLLRYVARWERRRNVKAKETETLTIEDLHNLVGKKTFGTIYADPPWPYDNQASEGAAIAHYDSLSIEELRALPVAQLAADPAHLHLWTTNGFLPEALDLMEAWGFDYKSVFVWVKPELGLGNYWRVCHEFLLLGVNGNCTFPGSERSWLEHPRRAGHSIKPAAVRKLVERVSPAPRLELFARTVHDGWVCWGNEIARRKL